MKEWIAAVLLFLFLLLVWEYFLGSKAPPTDVKAYVEGGKVWVEWKGGFGIAKAYEVHVVGDKDKVYALVEGERAQLSLPPGSYEIYVKAIRPAGESLPSERVSITVEGTPPKIYHMACQNGTLVVEGEDIEECTYSADGIAWAPLVEYGHPIEVEEEGTIFVRCINAFGRAEGAVLCK